MDTFAEGVATQVPFAMTTEVLREHLTDFRLVSDEAIKDGVRELFREDRIVMEGACATSLAAMEQMADDIRGSTIVVPVSGRNIAPDTFEELVMER
jgi:threonine dehydratase